MEISNFRPEFGNTKHIQAMEQVAKHHALKKEYDTCKAGAKKMRRLKEEMVRAERNFNALIRPKTNESLPS